MALQYRASLSHSLGLFPSTYVSLKVRFWVFFFFLQLKGCFLHLMAVLRIHHGHFLVCHGEELALDLGALDKLGNTRIFLHF